MKRGCAECAFRLCFGKSEVLVLQRKVKAGNKSLPFVYQFLFCLRLCLNVTAHLFLGDEDENIISNKERQIGHGFALAVLADGDEGASLDVI